MERFKLGLSGGAASDKSAHGGRDLLNGVGVVGLGIEGQL